MEQKILQIIGTSGVWFLGTQLRGRILDWNERNANAQNLRLPELKLDYRENNIRSKWIELQKNLVINSLNYQIPNAVGLLAIGGTLLDYFYADGRYALALGTFGILNLYDAFKNVHR